MLLFTMQQQWYEIMDTPVKFSFVWFTKLRIKHFCKSEWNIFSYFSSINIIVYCKINCIYCNSFRPKDPIGQRNELAIVLVNVAYSVIVVPR